MLERQQIVARGHARPAVDDDAIGRRGTERAPELFGERLRVEPSSSVRAQISTPWRTASGDPRSARRGRAKLTPRPPRVEAAPKTFLETGWAAVIVGAVGLAILTAAIVAGRLIGA